MWAEKTLGSDDKKEEEKEVKKGMMFLWRKRGKLKNARRSRGSQEAKAQKRFGYPKEILVKKIVEV